jgi:hypothetical protein
MSDRVTKKMERTWRACQAKALLDPSKKGPAGKHKARKDRGRRKKAPAGKQPERVRLRRREGRWATGMVQKRKARARKARRGA